MYDHLSIPISRFNACVIQGCGSIEFTIIPFLKRNRYCAPLCFQDASDSTKAPIMRSKVWLHDYRTHRSLSLKVTSLRCKSYCPPILTLFYLQIRDQYPWNIFNSRRYYLLSAGFVAVSNRRRAWKQRVAVYLHACVKWSLRRIDTMCRFSLDEETLAHSHRNSLRRDCRSLSKSCVTQTINQGIQIPRQNCHRHAKMDTRLDQLHIIEFCQCMSLLGWILALLRWRNALLFLLLI